MGTYLGFRASLSVVFMTKRVGAFPGHTAVEVGQFSDDGVWWWDGTTWIATAQIVLPQLDVQQRTGEDVGPPNYASASATSSRRAPREALASINSPAARWPAQPVDGTFVR
jgi:hypothetical protein